MVRKVVIRQICDIHKCDDSFKSNGKGFRKIQRKRVIDTKSMTIFGVCVFRYLFVFSNECFVCVSVLIEEASMVVIALALKALPRVGGRAL